MLQHFFKTQRSRNFASVLTLTSHLGVVTITAVATYLPYPVYAADFTFVPGDLVVSRSVYEGTADTVTVGQTLPGSNDPAIANGLYPNVFNNATPDPSFGVTSPIFLDQITTSGTKVNTLPVDPSVITTSFPSKSELSLNLTANDTGLTFMGYATGINQLDVSNSNTPGIIEPGNPVTTTPTYRAIAQVSADGTLKVTTTNAYAGNNG
ncbi:MAG: hypothetical protein JO235_01725, partial [Chroococcidiopsidaceae cyanobacterium CP_BM_RX_35]|nr:hypothetical protein [Chroococcidiopsidaceae cyanobacterium CP_BM_RX_35]